MTIIKHLIIQLEWDFIFLQGVKREFLIINFIKEHKEKNFFLRKKGTSSITINFDRCFNSDKCFKCLEEVSKGTVQRVSALKEKKCQAKAVL